MLSAKSESSFVIHIALQRQASLNFILFWEARAPAITTTTTTKKKKKQFIQWNLNIWIYDEYYNWVNSYNSSIMCQHSPLEVLRSKFKCKTFSNEPTLIKTTSNNKIQKLSWQNISTEMHSHTRINMAIICYSQQPNLKKKKCNKQTKNDV